MRLVLATASRDSRLPSATGRATPRMEADTPSRRSEQHDEGREHSGVPLHRLVPGVLIGREKAQNTQKGGPQSSPTRHAGQTTMPGTPPPRPPAPGSPFCGSCASLRLFRFPIGRSSMGTTRSAPGREGGQLPDGDEILRTSRVCPDIAPHVRRRGLALVTLRSAPRPDNTCYIAHLPCPLLVSLSGRAERRGRHLQTRVRRI